MESEESETFGEKNIFIPRKLRIFISYSEKNNKEFASAIKRELNHFGVQAFLAHDDIPPGEEWIPEILKNIKTADIFIALLSEDFCKSNWADQETGIAVCLDKFIIPVSIDDSLPYGFMNKYQAFRKFKYEIVDKFVTSTKPYKTEKNYIKCHDEILNIINSISEKTEFKENIKDSLIISLENVYAFRDAEEHFNILIKLESFSDEQINAIIERAIENKQIYDSHGCQKILKILIKKYSKNIKKGKKEELNNLIS